MFTKILIAISSEFMSEGPIKRAVEFAEKFNSEVKLLYIIEEKVLETMDKVAEGVQTYQEREKIKKDLIENHGVRSGEMILNKFEMKLKKTGINTKKKMVRGEFSEIIKHEIEKEKSDLIIISCQRSYLLNARLFQDINIPIWIESNERINKILAVCTNLAPNKKVPKISMALAKSYNAELSMIYVIDTKDRIMVDTNLRRSEKKDKQILIEEGKKFKENMEKKGVKTDVVIGSLEKIVREKEKKIIANLIIIGREQKKRRLLGVYRRNPKLKIAEKTKHSVLYLN
jgi:nucleotide-binding universal stress UspA family protein